jgi:TorA maturation chaperone TorD
MPSKSRRNEQTLAFHKEAPMNQPSNQQEWLNRATLCELLALGFMLPTPELAEAVTSGEFAEALEDVGAANALDEALWGQAAQMLRAAAAAANYQDKDSNTLFHELRIEYTHLFVGAPEPAVSPFAGVWWAKAHGVEPLLFVNTRSMDIERFMRRCGIGQSEGTNEPLDHIATMLEFLQYAALVNAGVVAWAEGADAPEDVSEAFVRDFMADWVEQFAETVQCAARLPFYQALGLALKAFLSAVNGCLS